jgi:hypothetical protein
MLIVSSLWVPKCSVHIGICWVLASQCNINTSQSVPKCDLSYAWPYKLLYLSPHHKLWSEVCHLCWPTNNIHGVYIHLSIGKVKTSKLFYSHKWLTLDKSYIYFFFQINQIDQAKFNIIKSTLDFLDFFPKNTHTHTKWTLHPWRASLHKGDMPNLITYLNYTPIFEWYIVKCGSNNGYRTNMCWIIIWIHANKLIPILSSTINMAGGRPI